MSREEIRVITMQKERRSGQKTAKQKTRITGIATKSKSKYRGIG